MKYDGDREWYMWIGVVCEDCTVGLEHSPANSVAVDQFEHCPYCGKESLEHLEVRLPLGEPIYKYLSGEIDVYPRDE